MLSARILLCSAALVTLTLPRSPSNRPPEPLDRKEEYKHSSQSRGHGQEGQLPRRGRQGRHGGPRFSLDLSVKAVHKPKDEQKPKKGDVVSINGRTMDKKMKTKYFVPAEKNDVIAFVKKTKDGKYEALEPKGFETTAISAGLGRGPAPGAKKEEKKDK